MFFGSDQNATSSLHSTSVIKSTGEVLVISLAGTPLKYCFFSLYRWFFTSERITSVQAAAVGLCSLLTDKRPYVHVECIVRWLIQVRHCNISTYKPKFTYIELCHKGVEVFFGICLVFLPMSKDRHLFPNDYASF